MNLEMFMNLWLTVSASSAAIIIGSALKSLLIVGAAFVMLTIARNSAPVKRVLISRLALLTMVVLPFAILLIPSIRLAIPGFFGSAWSTVVLSASISSVAETGKMADSGIIVPWTAWLVLVWLAGATAVWVRVTAGILLTARTVRKSEPVTDRSIIDMQASVAGRIGIQTAVRITRSDAADIPFAWGLLKPVIVLPKSSCDWPPEALRMVLLHETSHIKRDDTIWALIGCAATVLYWFNPLVWILRKRMVIEAEKTCDDIVLHAGGDAPSYAAHLLEVARQIRRRRIIIPAGIAMARRAELEGRLLSILSNRKRVVDMKNWMSRMSTVIALLFVLSLAGLQLYAADVRGPSSPPGITGETQTEPADTADEQLPSSTDFVPVTIYPEQVSCEEPEYPKEAKKAGKQGTVWVQALVDKHGKVRKAQVQKSSGHEILDDTAVKAAYGCEYKPAIQDGKPVAVWITYKVSFTLADAK